MNIRFSLRHLTAATSCFLIFAGTAPRSSAASFFADVNNDGISDEVFQAQTLQFTTTVGYSSGCYYNWNSYWYLFSPLFWTGEYRSDFNIYFSPSVSYSCFSTTYIQMVVQFTASSGYTYRVIGEYGGGSSNPDLRGKPGTDYSGSGQMYITQPMMPLPIANNMRYWVVKYEKPYIFTDQATLPGGIFVSSQTDPNPFLGASWVETELITDTLPTDAADKIRIRIEEFFGRPLGTTEIEAIRQNGCIGVAMSAMRSRWDDDPARFILPATIYPERTTRPEWEIKAFLTLADAEAYSCLSSEKTVTYIITGYWDGDPPEPDFDGSVPVDSIRPTNWIVRLPPPNEDKWFSINHGLGSAPNDPQEAKVFEGNPPPDFPGGNIKALYIRVCIDNP